MQVVDCEEQRPLLREPEHEPEQRVQRRERCPFGVRVGFPEDGRGRGGGAGEQRLLPLGRRKLSLEELPDHAEGKLALEPAAPGREHPHGSLRTSPGLRDQTALADAGGPVDDHDASVPRRGARDIPLDLLDLAPPLQQPFHATILGWNRPWQKTRQRRGPCRAAHARTDEATGARPDDDPSDSAGDLRVERRG